MGPAMLAKGQKMTTKIKAESLKVGDKILPPEREVQLWMRRTLQDRNLPESALHLTIASLEADTANLRRRYRVSIGVIAPRTVADLDAERYAAEDNYASLVAQIAAREIDNWGSYYGHADILKRDAKQSVQDALRLAKETRPRKIGQ